MPKHTEPDWRVAVTAALSKWKKQKRGKRFHQTKSAKHQYSGTIMRCQYIKSKKKKRHEEDTPRMGKMSIWCWKHWIVITLIIITIIAIICMVCIKFELFFGRNFGASANARFMSGSIAVTLACVVHEADPFLLIVVGFFFGGGERHWFKISCNLTQCLFYIKSP